MRGKYLLFLLIPLTLALTGCFNNSDFRGSKTANLTLTITPTTVYIGRATNMKITLRETNGVGIGLDYWAWHSVKTGYEAEKYFDGLFGMHYLLPWGTLESSRLYITERQPTGKRVVTMGGEDSNGNTIRASAEYWVRR